MAAIFVANLIRYRREGFRPDRDLVVALTADEEGGGFNGASWLVRNRRELVDAEFGFNEGGGGRERAGRPLFNGVQASDEVALLRVAGVDDDLHVLRREARGAQPRGHLLGRHGRFAAGVGRVRLDQLLVDVEEQALMLVQRYSLRACGVRREKREEERKERHQIPNPVHPVHPC